MNSRKGSPRVLVTGATGYVGGRLVEALQSDDVALRCMARNPRNLGGRFDEGVEIVRGDCLERESLAAALHGIDTAYYLVHSMGSGEGFAPLDREAARNFGQMARSAGVRRIVYLGGLGQAGSSEGLSAHLKSRQETGAVLRESGVPVIEFRASIILGSGSLSFELIRALVERLPCMICPRWVRTKAQPIHIQDVIAYLRATLELPQGMDSDGGRVYEIGGTDVVSYEAIMLEYARQRGLRRWLIRVPFLSPRISSLWLGLTTPVYARVGRKLIGSIRNATIVEEQSAKRDFDIHPAGLEESIRRAMTNEDRRYAVTRWSDALSSSGTKRSWTGVKFGTRLIDSRSCQVPCVPAAAFAPIRRIGGRRGWYHATVLWRIRGLIDLLVGGVGFRRGRRNPETLAVGDAVDFWRVEKFEPDHLLRLSAEMKLPGRAWLEFEVKAGQDGGSTIYQTAVFDPVGLLGRLYWYGIYPLHLWVFRGMLRSIARAALRG